ncbi:MAG: PAS domain S-box protein [Deltaproteobacteria bacterium]|nr:PAS domain S-box protein [Deltaproteobacteria bacterium]
MNPATAEDLYQEVQYARESLEGLHQRAGSFPTDTKLLDEALGELSSALEELQVSVEEMRQYSEKLLAGRQEIDAERRRYRELLEFAPAGYLVTDTFHNIREANRMVADLFHTSQDYLVGEPLAALICEDDRESFRELLTRLSKQDSVEKLSTRVVVASGFSLPVVLRASQIRDGRRGLLGLRWWVQDTTERKQMEEALCAARDELEKKVRERTAELVSAKEVLRTEVRERKRIENKLSESEEQLRCFGNELEQQRINSNRLVFASEMVAAIAHKFTNSLQIALGFAEDLLSRTEPADNDHQPLTMIANQMLRCKDLLKDVLHFTHPNQSKLALSSVEPVICNAVKLAHRYLETSMVTAELDLQSDLPQINADCNQLQQMLINLFYNAADAMPRGGTLTIRASTNRVDSADTDENGSHELTIAVCDAGVGMDCETRSKIFQPFFSTKEKKGMGLGLYICDRIMKAHGGKITVASMPGTGSTFFLHFPLAQE